MQSPSYAKASSRHQDRFSGLWEWYFDDETTPSQSAEGEVGFEDDCSRLKNIRGFLMKRRKSPLKGWHKVMYMSRGERARGNSS